MDKCYEYFNCVHKDCPARKAPEGVQCWEVDGTECQSRAMKMIAEDSGGKKYSYKNCIYYRIAKTK